MADLSLDEIIAKKKGLKVFKVQFANRNGKPAQKFAARQGHQSAFQQKRPLSNHGAAITSSNRRGNPVGNSGNGQSALAKGQIDARDTITIKNRIKMSDARVKIVQKRINKLTFDARSKLQPRNVPQQRRRPEGGVPAPVPQQQMGFQNNLQIAALPGQQRFQLSQAPNFSLTTNRMPALNQKKTTDLLNFTVAVNPGVSSSNNSRPAGPLTRTLQNPLASGGALVENTGSSLKITRAIPDVTFDGQNLTVTRRLPQSSKKQGSSSSASAPKTRMDSDRGPVIQIQNDKFQPTSAPTSSSANPLRSRQAPTQGGLRARSPSPIQPPTSSKRPSKPSRAEDSGVKTVSGYPAEARYKATKNTLLNKTPELEPEAEDRLRASPSPGGGVITLPSKRPFQPGTSSSQHQAHSVPTSSKPSKSSQHVSKRLAPRPSAQPQTEQRSSGSSKASKRRAPMSLSERFAARETGSSSPVIVDYVPPKKRRVPEPEPEKEEFEEDSEVKEQSEEEEEPETPLISPLQGFRMLVSNLHASVTQDDIIELFGAIGPLKRANILTKGQAEVAYIHREHAVLALKKYHNRELDGQPMFVKVTTPLNAKVIKPIAAEENSPGLPPSLRSNKKVAAPSTTSAPVEIPLIHKALFKTGMESTPAKSVRFTVKL